MKSAPLSHNPYKALTTEAQTRPLCSVRSRANQALAPRRLSESLQARPCWEERYLVGGGAYRLQGPVGGARGLQAPGRRRWSRRPLGLAWEGGAAEQRR